MSSTTISILAKIVQVKKNLTKTTGDEYLFLELQGKNGGKWIVYAFMKPKRWWELLTWSGKFYQFDLAENKIGSWNLLDWKIEK